MTRQSLISRLRRIAGNPGLWFILALLVLITIVHYAEIYDRPPFLARLRSDLGLTRQAFERILYLAPIVWAGFLFGWRGAAVTSLVALGCMLPRVIFISPSPIDALFETSAVFVIGNVLAISFNSLRKERERRIYLAALNQTSSVVSQFLELRQVLNSSIDIVMKVMRADIVLVFLLDEKTGELVLSAHHGVSNEFAQGVDRLKLGEGFNGRVAETGESLYVEDASQDPRLTRTVVTNYEVHSALIVPLSSKGKVNGTLCVAMRSQRQFQQQEVELLTAIGNQIGVAVENARLYQQQEEVAEQLRTMQENLHLQLQQVSRAQEEERKRISRELHDDSIQELIVLSRQIDALATSEELPEKQRQRLEELLKKIEGIMQGIRRLSQDLRPAALDRLGLIPALEWLASDIAKYSGLATKVNVVGTPRRFPEEIELVLFRIVQEALRNAWRHAEATETNITAEFDKDKTRITITDNGKGFRLPGRIGDLARDGKLGLSGMQERAQLIGGTLSIESEPGKGCSVIVELP